ncbi:hypothetical protein B9Z19DRAFT_1090377, partial [Tuber borchii]
MGHLSSSRPVQDSQQSVRRALLVLWAIGNTAFKLASSPGSSFGFDLSATIQRTPPNTSGLVSLDGWVVGMVHRCNEHTPTEGCYHEYIPGG